MEKYLKFISEHPAVEEWLRNRPKNTQRVFAVYLMHFCKTMNVTPEGWRGFYDKFEARDLAWKYLQPIVREHSSVARLRLTALKSWYRNLKGEQLPFNSGRGGKHYIPLVHKKRSIEHIPNKNEMYQIIDMASSLRDKAMLLLLFQSGVRVNVLEHLTYGDVKRQLDRDIITLKVTPDLDIKLRGRDIPFYYTFLNGEGSETLKRYCEMVHKDSKPETPLFPTKGNKAIGQRYVWRIVKMCVERAGFDTKTVWTNTIRKAFRKIVRQANIDDDDKEQLMGHVIQGSRQAYYDKKDVELIRKAYEKCNFAREVPESETTKLRKQLEDEQTKRLLNEMRLEKLEKELETTRGLLKGR